MVANAEHLMLLRQGAEVWNLWRNESPNAIPDLGGAKLARFSLQGIDFTHANLIEVDLSGANLHYARLHSADLRLANLARANLTGTDLTNALLMNTILVDTNLQAAVGLETCSHNGPSYIDNRTVERSAGVPARFLQACGIPTDIADLFASASNRKRQYFSCFISYSKEDGHFAQKLYADLQRAGVFCWFAPEHLRIGDNIRSRLDEVIHEHDKLLLILSCYSISSSWVGKEVETAIQKENERRLKTLFPVSVDDAIELESTGWAADIRRARHIGDFRYWEQDARYARSLERLLRDLRIEGDYDEAEESPAERRSTDNSSRLEP